MGGNWTQNVTFWPKLNVTYWGIAKSGSTTIKNHLLLYDKGVVLKHTMSAHKPMHLNFVPPVYKEGSLNFTVVRHPYSRFASMYTDFFKYRPENRPVAQHKYLDLSWTDREFCEYLASKRPNQLNIHFKPQHLFLKDSRIKVMRLEELSTDWCLDIPAPTNRLNMTAEKQYELSDDVKKLVDSLYKKDFDLWETRTVKV